jgi:hypothetical protein
MSSPPFTGRRCVGCNRGLPAWRRARRCYGPLPASRRHGAKKLVGALERRASGTRIGIIEELPSASTLGRVSKVRVISGTGVSVVGYILVLEK